MVQIRISTTVREWSRKYAIVIKIADASMIGAITNSLKAIPCEQLQVILYNLQEIHHNTIK